MNIFTLMGTIMVDSAAAEKSISSTSDKAESFGTKIGKGIKTAAKWGAAIGAGAAVVGAGMYKMATSSAETTDRIDKLSQKIGMSRQGFQEMDFIASQSGMAIESLQVGFKTLRGAMEQAEKGTGKGAEAFKALGVSVTDSSGNLRDQEDVFNEAVNALQGMEDGTEKAMLATKLFGKSGQEMMPMLNGAAGSIDEMRQQAHDLGLVMSDESIDAGVAFTDTIDQLQRSFKTAVAEIGVQFMPIITKFADFIMGNMPLIQSTISTAFDVFGQVIGTAVEWVGEAVTWFKKLGDIIVENKDIIVPAFAAMAAVIIGTMIPAWVAQATAAITAAAATAAAMLPVTLVIAAVGVAVAGLALIWRKWGDDIMAVVKPVVDKVVTWFKDMTKLVVETTVETYKNVKKAFELIKKYIEEPLAAAQRIVETVWNYIKQTFMNVIAFITAFVKGDFQGMKDVISNQMGLIKTTVSKIWDDVKTIFTNAIDIIKTAVSDTFDKAVEVAVGFGKKFFDAGANIVGSIADGIKSAISKVTDAIGNVVGKVRDFLPFSPAKTGPLRDINKLNFAGPISDSIESAIPKVSEMMGKLLSMPELSVSSSLNNPSMLGVNSSRTGNGWGNAAINQQLSDLTEAIYSLAYRPQVLRVDGKTIAESSYQDISRMMLRDVKQTSRAMGMDW